MIIYLDLIDPGVSVETNIETDSEIETGIPVDEDKDIEHDLEDSEGIGEVGTRLSFVEKLEHSLYFRNSVEPHNDIAWNLIMALAREEKVKEISR